MIRYNNISRPFHDPPRPSCPKSGGSPPTQQPQDWRLWQQSQNAKTQHSVATGEGAALKRSVLFIKIIYIASFIDDSSEHGRSQNRIRGCSSSRRLGFGSTTKGSRTKGSTTKGSRQKVHDRRFTKSQEKLLHTKAPWQASEATAS